MEKEKDALSAAGAVTFSQRPFGFEIQLPPVSGGVFNGHLERRLSALQGQFADRHAFDSLLPSDPLIYEVYEMHRPQVAGELLHGLSIVHPGRVGDEYFMTKGHYHSLRATGEIYYCLQGRGILLMENETGEWTAEHFTPGRVVYVTPGWAHRSINTADSEDLITFFVYPGDAGHDYATIEQRGFRKRVLAGDGIRIVDNPAWLSAREEG